MLKLEEKIKKFTRNIAVVGGILLGSTTLNAQNVVSGTIQSIPSKTTPTEAKITLTNTSTGAKYAQRTRDGTFSLNVPSGTYEERVEVVGSYLIQGNLVVNGNKVISEKTMEDKPLTSQMYLDGNKSLLFLLKNLTATWDGSSRGTLIIRARDPPLKIDARNYNPLDPLSMPQGIRPYLDTTLNDINVKTNGIVQFVETGVEPVRVQFQYPGFAGMPMPGFFGWALFTYDLTNIWIDRDLLLYYQSIGNHQKNYGIFARELYRALNMDTYSADPNMVSYHSGPTTGRFHPDEIEIIKRVYTLDNGTDMARYKDIVVASIPNLLPQIITFSAPTNNSTVTYVNDNLAINYTAINPRDGDGETQKVVIRLRGNNLDQYITDTNTDGIIQVPKTIFEPLKQYTLEGMTISGFDTIPATNIITFNTPNIPPTIPTLLIPTNNSIIAPNQSNNFIWRKSADTDPVRYTLNITGIGQNLIYNNLTDTVFILPANTLKQNKTYNWKVSATDGQATVESTTRTLTTSNIPPTASTLHTPTNNATLQPNQPNTFKWTKSKDDDQIIYRLNITGIGQNLIYNNLTDTVFILPANTLKQNKTYNWNVEATDGQATISSNTRQLLTDNIAPGAFNILSHKAGDTVNITKDIKYVWSKSKDDDLILYTIEFSDAQNNKLTFTNITDTTYTVLANNLQQKPYNIKIIADDSKTTTETPPININTTTTIEDIIKSKDLKIYPNPVINNITVYLQTSRPAKMTIEIYDITGKLRENISENVYTDYQDIIDMSKYASGMYIMNIQLRDNNNQIIGTERRKIIKR